MVGLYFFTGRQALMGLWGLLNLLVLTASAPAGFGQGVVNFRFHANNGWNPILIRLGVVRTPRHDPMWG